MESNLNVAKTKYHNLEENKDKKRRKNLPNVLCFDHSGMEWSRYSLPTSAHTVVTKPGPCVMSVLALMAVAKVELVVQTFNDIPPPFIVHRS